MNTSTITQTTLQEQSAPKTKIKQDDTELFKQYANIVAKQHEFIEKELEPPKKLERERIQVRNQLIEKNQALVSYMVSKYYNKPEHRKIREDLVQEGILGLVSAIDGFNVELGYRFSTYSTWWIRQAINTYLAEYEPIIHIPTHIRAAQNKVLKGMSQSGEPFSKDFNGRFFEESKTLEYTPKMVNSIKSALQTKNVSSLDKTLLHGPNSSDAGTYTLKDTIPDKKETVGQVMDSNTLVGVMASGLKKLSDKNRNILLLRFNVIDEGDVAYSKED